MLHVYGRAYFRTTNTPGGTLWYENPEAADSYLNSPYPGAVSNFTGFAKTSGANITRGGACKVAGVAGRSWTITSPATSTLTKQETACVAGASGVLLSLRTTASGTAVPSGTFYYRFTINQIGNVSAIKTPAPLHQAG